MSPDAFAERIAPYEVLPAQELSPGSPIVARLLGRRFEQLYDKGFQKPFDPGLGKMLVKTLSHLCANLGASFGYAERDGLSLCATSTGGEARRLLSRIGGEASAKMSLLLGDVATFDTRLYSFAVSDDVRDFFAWRRAEAQAQALDLYCAHALASSGADPAAVPHILEGLDADEKYELLRQNQFDWESVPPWQRYGVGVYVAPGAAGAQLVVDLQLPSEDDYAGYLQRFVA
jgi:tRNA(His) 5'-end guanylyltransferase